MNRKHIFTAALVGILTVFIGYFLFTPQELNIGTELPDAPALFETSLAAPITATANSMTLTSNSVRGGGSLSGYNCFTIDEGSAQAEFVCGTASSTSVTGLVRGISPSDGTTADTDLQFSHRRGASVKITDFPIVQILRNQNNGDATFENVLRYAASVVPNGASDLADVGYVLSVVNGGSVNFDALVVAGTAGETVATGTVVYFDGTDQEWKKVDTDTSTTYQAVPVGITQGSGVNGGTIGNGGVLLAGLDETQTGMTIGSTYYASTTAGGIGKTATGLRLGKAKSATQLYVVPEVDLTMTNNTWSGTNIFSGSTFGFGSSTLNVYTGNTSWTKPAKFKYITVWTCGGGGGGGGNNNDSATAGGSGGGAGGGCAFENLTPVELIATTSVQVVVGAAGTAGASAGGTGGTGGTSNFGTFLSATGGTGGVEAGAGGTGGTGTGGDFNITGDAGGRFQYGEFGVTGGSSHFGGGGVAGLTHAAGGTGGQYSGGGGGASDGSGGATALAGGAGAAGIVIVQEFY